MKNIITLTLTVLTILAGCSGNEEIKPQVIDEIEVTPASITFEAEGGEEDVIITSSGKWTVEGNKDYDWILVSALEGNDGDIITFSVEPNKTEDKEATYVFTCGKSTFTFKVFSYADPEGDGDSNGDGDGDGDGDGNGDGDGELDDKTIKLLSDKNVVLGNAASTLTVKISTSKCHYRNITYLVTGNSTDWLSHRMTLQGDVETDADLHFDVSALEGLEDRSAQINISGPGLDPVSVNITQEALKVLSSDKNSCRFTAAGGTESINVTSNVKYSISAEGGDGWLTIGTATADVIPLTVSALTSGNIRTATITLTQTDAKAGVTPLTAQITVQQSKEVITKAANMKGNYFDITWNNQHDMSQLKVFTVEWLMRGDKWKNSNNNSVSSIFGVEQEKHNYAWLIRIGDIDIGDNKLQIARTVDGTNTHWTTDVTFNESQWYHVAFTYNMDTGSAKVYVDGVLVDEDNTWANATVNLSQYCRISKSYDDSRYIEGCLSELRIWNVERTSAEIAANMYEYNGDKTNLLGYWKLNEGQGKTVADHSGHNQTLTAFQDITWETVSLP